MILRIDYYLMIMLFFGIMERTKGCIRDGLEDQQGRPSQEGGLNRVDFEPVSES
jgi:hypothetical protein